MRVTVVVVDVNPIIVEQHCRPQLYLQLGGTVMDPAAPRLWVWC